MFLRNRTSYEVALAKAHLLGRVGIGAVVVRSVYRAAEGRLTPWPRDEEAPPPLPTDPPDASRSALWVGVSVTAAGDVLGPRTAPFVAAAELAVGEAIRRLSVFGARRWRRTFAGELEPSPAEPFERLAMSFSRAFGGAVDVPPGLFPGTELPFPGGRIGYVLNDGGVGFALDEAAAEESVLPNFELSEQRIARWDDRPEPGCFVPCPELVALRVAPVAAAIPGAGGDAPGRGDATRLAIAAALRAAHHAPGYLIFDELPAGTAVRLKGVGRRPLRCDVPPPPVRVGVRRTRGVEEAPAALRSLHLDADRETVTCTHGYAFRYELDRAPSWITVDPLAS